MNFNIKGFHLRNRVDYKGHEGEPLAQADLYLKEPGKKLEKVGFLSDGDWGGPSVERFKSKEVEEKYLKVAEEIYGDRKSLFDKREFMFNELFSLLSIETALRKDYKVSEIKELSIIFCFQNQDNIHPGKTFYDDEFYKKYPITDTGTYDSDGYYKYRGKDIDKFIKEVVEKKEEYYRVVKAKDLMEGNLEPLKKKNIKVK